MAPYFIQETQLVGFEYAREELVGLLMGGTDECCVVSIVGLGGVGKTTLAKLLFDDPLVIRHFDCRSFITVS
ncbi:NBS-containing resistance-like protein, partial [Trifolium medium]|nr:NBS-containing resistance-like protein [Trifolium medium]